MNVWDDADTQLMVTAAHRYCLHRKTYITHAGHKWLEENRANFNRQTIFMIVRDTIRAIMGGNAGSETIDAPGWRRLALLLFSEMREDDRASIREQFPDFEGIAE